MRTKLCPSSRVRVAACLGGDLLLIEHSSGLVRTHFSFCVALLSSFPPPSLRPRPQSVYLDFTTLVGLVSGVASGSRYLHEASPPKVAELTSFDIVVDWNYSAKVRRDGPSPLIAPLCAVPGVDRVCLQSVFHPSLLGTSLPTDSDTRFARRQSLQSRRSAFPSALRSPTPSAAAPPRAPSGAACRPTAPRTTRAASCGRRRRRFGTARRPLRWTSTRAFTPPPPPSLSRWSRWRLRILSIAHIHTSPRLC